MNNFDNSMLSAAYNLVGKTIGGWYVSEKIPKNTSPTDTGGNFSICYKVEKNGTSCFMKVLDIVAGFSGGFISPKDITVLLQEQLSEFNYEKALSAYCNSRRVSKVINYIDSGEVNIPGYIIPIVSYIVYEMANGNVRHFLNFSLKVDFATRLKSFADKIESLRDVATGLSSLHMNQISHQDIKPSNIMKFDNESKIGDLGRSLCFDESVNCPFSLNSFNGDWTYAPPEVFFKYALPDLKERLYQMDNYTLGSLIVYYLIGVSLNAVLDRNLPNPIRELCASGINFEAAKVFLLDAFQKSLDEIRAEIPLEEIKDELIGMIEYLCFPIPEKRGHPINVNPSNRTPNYDLHRTITDLDRMYRKAKIELSKLS
jgi:serine/threonine protein kinase